MCLPCGEDGIFSADKRARVGSSNGICRGRSRRLSVHFCLKRVNKKKKITYYKILKHRGQLSKLDHIEVVAVALRYTLLMSVDYLEQLCIFCFSTLNATSSTRSTRRARPLSP